MHRDLAKKATSNAQKIAVVCIKGYRLVLSPWLGNQCRFYPSCSHYTESAISHYGVCKGILFGAWRILRCNPFHPGGYDPIPCETTQTSKRAYEHTKNT